MKTKIFILICNLILSSHLNSQNITNTLGANGLFSIKDGSVTYFSLSQSNGHLSLGRSLSLPNTTSSLLGVIYKGGVRFLHDYREPNSYGYNTFLGMDAGNFTLGWAGFPDAGSYNTGVGTGALNKLTIGYYNSAFGVNALNLNTDGYSNSAFGVGTLGFNTTGALNSAFGSSAMGNNRTGNNNSAFGLLSLFSNNTGNENTAFGSYTLFANSSGWHNTAVGFDALKSNTTGWQNTAVGHHSLNFNTGNYNTALGYNSGSSVTTGFNLTLIGIDANPSSSTAGNQITLGNGFVTSLRCNVTTITSLSDARDKKNIKDLSLGLDFITKLKPRQFNWDKREWYDENISDGSKMQEAPTAGFIAQELDEAQTNADAEWLNLVLKDNPEKWEATAGNLLPVMVKAIQELKAENDELKERLEKLEKKDVQLTNGK
jgi:trimeric autotransporter adhesin